MKTARLAALGFAAVAFGGAFMLMNGTKPAPSAPQQIVQVAAPVQETEEILVAKQFLEIGTLVTEQDLTWQIWPKDAIAEGMLRKGAAGNELIADIRGSVTRAQFFKSEPIRREKLVKGPNSGFLSAILASGSRAVAIAIDPSGVSGAGGFILPNDHVDVMRTVRDADASKSDGAEVYKTETILHNIRVLAIGPNIQEKNGERVVLGGNATLELDTAQAEIVILSERLGKLSLALRSMLDSAKSPTDTPPPANDASLTIVRFGMPTQVKR